MPRAIIETHRGDLFEVRILMGLQIPKFCTSLTVQWSPYNSRIKQNVEIIHTSKTMEQHTVVRITVVRIIRDVQISKGQIIWAVRYHGWRLGTFRIYFADLESTILAVRF